MAAQGWVLGGKHRGRARRPGRMGVSLPPTNLWAGMFAKAVTPPPHLMPLVVTLCRV